MGATITTIQDVLKFVYTSRELQNAVYKDNPALALMKKQSGFTGKSHIHAITYRNPLARSAAFGTAQGRARINGNTTGEATGVSEDVQFVVTRVKNYAHYSIEQEAILASRGDKGAFISAVSQQLDGTLQTLNNDMGRDVYGSGLGELGQLTGVNSLTFTVGEAITQIEVGMELVASNGSTKTAALRGDPPTPMNVVTVNRAAGTFTVDANTDSAASGDWLFISGDRPIVQTTTIAASLKMAGFEAWNPYTTPAGSESFFGVDRSIDATRLAGHRLDISSLQPEEGYITALAALAREGGSPSHIFTSFLDEKNLKLALGSRVEAEYTEVGDIGFESMRIRGPKGTVRVYADRNAPAGFSRLLQLDTWELKHLGDLINKGDAGNDGGLARETGADSFEGRLSCYGNMVCYKPAANMVVKLPT